MGKQSIFSTSSLAARALGLLLMVMSAGTADARGGHGFSRGFGGRHGASFAGDRRHADDPYIKAAAQEEEKLLAKLKNICRGC